MRVLNVQGRKKTGKTTTVVNIVAELCRRGYSVGTIKGIHIDGFTMDVPGEDTDKHKKAGANPVTARCHDETNVMFKGKMNLRQILEHYDTDWVVIESHVDLRCPNIATGRTANFDGEDKDVSLAEQVNEFTIACSGVISNEITEFRGLPVINSMTEAEKLVDIIEGKSVGIKRATDKSMAARHKATQPIISEPDKEFSLIETNEFVRVGAGNQEDSSMCKNFAHGTDSMLTESTIEININGKYVGSIPHTPQYLAELVLGWILAEGYIENIDDVDSLDISEDGTKAEVFIFGAVKAKPLKPVTPIAWKKEWIFELAKDFEDILPLREKTMAAHNCRLARGHSDDVGDTNTEILFKCEDIGRHSAIDKAVGWALRNGVDTKSCVLFTSGRVSRAMVQKTIRAGIPVMAGKGTISKRAVQLAGANNLTLIGYAKKDSFCIFNAPD